MHLPEARVNVMTRDIQPHKIAVWEFFDQNTDACDAGSMAVYDTLNEQNRQVPEFFIPALSGSRRVLDLGCGEGYPGLYVAPHVGELVGLDAAPNVTPSARNAGASWTERPGGRGSYQLSAIGYQLSGAGR